MKNKGQFRWTVLLAAVLLLGVGLTSCYPGGPVTNEEYDILGTVYDESADFSALRTYSLPDTVVVASDGVISQGIDPVREDIILAEIRRNMAYMGFVEEPNPILNPPDVIITATSWKVTNVETYSYYDYWGWYGGWGYYPWWGVGYNPYYNWGYSQVYTYNTGTLILDMYDMTRPNETDQEVPAVWVGAINGLLEGNETGIDLRVKNGIQDLFDQSPYLRGDK